MAVRIEIPLKLPSCNEYIDACRTNYHVGNNLKKKVEDDMIWFLNKLPKFKKPIKINFTWIEKNQKRDLDRYLFCKEVYIRCIAKMRKT